MKEPIKIPLLVLTRLLRSCPQFSLEYLRTLGQFRRETQLRERLMSDERTMLYAALFKIADKVRNEL